MSRKSTEPVQVYQVKVTLRGSKPPIWRRILVTSDITFYKLHRILQVVMGWWESHLHMFEIYGQNIGDPQDDEWGELGICNERRYKLGQFDLREGAKFTYEYDFGDSWDHELLVEKVLPPEAGAQYPTCLKGKRACPPEDVGGVWGYEEFLEAMRDADHPKHDDLLEWIGGEFDPEEFDLEAVNAALKRLR